jgi:hypothetical protein
LPRDADLQGGVQHIQYLQEGHQVQNDHPTILSVDMRILVSIGHVIAFSRKAGLVPEDGVAVLPELISGNEESSSRTVFKHGLLHNHHRTLSPTCQFQFRGGVLGTSP